MRMEAWLERCFVAGFEDERRQQAKECVQRPEARKNQETDSPLEPPEGL